MCCIKIFGSSNLLTGYSSNLTCKPLFTSGRSKAYQGPYMLIGGIVCDKESFEDKPRFTINIVEQTLKTQ